MAFEDWKSVAVIVSDDKDMMLAIPTGAGGKLIYEVYGPEGVSGEGSRFFEVHNLSVIPRTEDSPEEVAAYLKLNLSDDSATELTE